MSFWSTPRSCCNGKQMLAKIPKASKSIKVNQSTVTLATSADFPAPCDFIHETCWHQLVDLVIWSTDPRSRATAAVCWNSLELCHWILCPTETQGYPEMTSEMGLACPKWKENCHADTCAYESWFNVKLRWFCDGLVTRRWLLLRMNHRDSPKSNFEIIAPRPRINDECNPEM